MKNIHERIRQEEANFLHNLAVLRCRHGLSKKQMATILKISIKTLNKIEQGIQPPRLGVEVIFEAMMHFHIPAAALFAQRLE
ncbi:MAG: helix-turn-helix transcriptional regulator [Clostridia bacterium]|nr:helix-turn-helix transcriptional regulator [Clostridia bacterium]